MRIAPKVFLSATVALGLACAWLMVIFATASPSLSHRKAGAGIVSSRAL